MTVEATIALDAWVVSRDGRRAWAGWPTLGIVTIDDAIAQHARWQDAPGMPDRTVQRRVAREQRRRAEAPEIPWGLTVSERVYLVAVQAVDDAIARERASHRHQYRVQVREGLDAHGEDRLR